MEVYSKDEFELKNIIHQKCHFARLSTDSKKGRKTTLTSLSSFYLFQSCVFHAAASVIRKEGGQYRLLVFQHFKCQQPGRVVFVNRGGEHQSETAYDEEEWQNNLCDRGPLLAFGVDEAFHEHSYELRSKQTETGQKG